MHDIIAFGVNTDYLGFYRTRVLKANSILVLETIETKIVFYDFVEVEHVSEDKDNRFGTSLKTYLIYN